MRLVFNKSTGHNTLHQKLLFPFCRGGERLRVCWRSQGWFTVNQGLHPKICRGNTFAKSCPSPALSWCPSFSGRQGSPEWVLRLPEGLSPAASTAQLSCLPVVLSPHRVLASHSQAASPVPSLVPVSLKYTELRPNQPTSQQNQKRGRTPRLPADWPWGFGQVPEIP